MDKTQTVLVLLAFLTNISAIVFGYLSGTNTGGLFHQNMTYLGQKYFQEISPVGTAFDIIWPIIFLWNLIGIVYIVVSLFLPGSESPVNYKPTLIPKSFLFFYCIAFGSATAWLFTFDRELLATSFFVLLTGTFSAHIAVAISCKNVYDNLHSLEKSNQALLWLIRILIQNGLALITTWLTVATSINMGMVIIYKDSPDTKSAQLRGLFSMEDASTLMLVVVLIFAVTWFVQETFIYQKYYSALFTTFPVLIFAFTGILVKLQPLPSAERNFVVSCVGVGICGLLFLARLGLSIYRFVTHRSYVVYDKEKLKLIG